MNPVRLMTRTATITHVEPDEDNPDAYGNPGELTETTTALCELQQIVRTENTVDANTQTGDWALFLAPTGEDDGGYTVPVVLEGADHVEIDGTRYELIGPPWPVRNPRTGLTTHIEARVRQVV